jgi:hypothetical protein
MMEGASDADEKEEMVLGSETVSEGTISNKKRKDNLSV